MCVCVCIREWREGVIPPHFLRWLAADLALIGVGLNVKRRFTPQLNMADSLSLVVHAHVGKRGKGWRKEVRYLPKVTRHRASCLHACAQTLPFVAVSPSTFYRTKLEMICCTVDILSPGVAERATIRMRSVCAYKLCNKGPRWTRTRRGNGKARRREM